MRANRERSWPYAAGAGFLAGVTIAVPVIARSRGAETSVPALTLPVEGEVGKGVAEPKLRFARDPFVAPPGEAAGDVRGGSENGLVVRAIALGEHPAALVDIGGQTTVVTVGDRLADSTVVRITATAVTLSSGTRIALAEEKP